MRWSLVAAALVQVLCALVVARTSSSSDYLLPGDVAPAHYDVRLLFDIDPATNYSYYAVADIYVTVKKPTSKVILHAQDFSFEKNAILLQGDTETLRPTAVSLNDTYSLLTIQFGETLEEGNNYTLTIPFYGNLKMGLDGAYISSYVDKDTQEKEYLITTQFESISARKGFPCFDEPLYKATFNLAIGHNKGYTAVSNMPLYNSTSDNLIYEHWPWQVIKMSFQKEQSEFVWDQFETSVPMSTYLVAYVVSKFSYVESPPELSPGTQFRIWARKDAMDQTAYAAKTGPKVLAHFEEFFNVSFPLPKQDMFAIPDFSAGAMENWGLITYRETSLLYDKEESSTQNKERVAEVIAHELAHQWFGNLVTMKWWSDLWLNEGFATYVASIGVHAVEPTWGADVNLAVENILSVMNLDALENSHPVSVPITDPKRISEIFDEIAYRKGSSLIRMMTMFLGDDVFRKAIHQYIVKYSYQNAEQDDLWQELTEVSKQYNALTRNVTVKQVMDTWTTQTGYPILTVTRDYSDNSVTVTQKRYLNLGAKASTAVSWWVPLSVLCESEVGQEPDPVQWLADTEGVHNKHRYEHSANSNEWILFNYDMVAPYRVNYDARNWQLLSDSLLSRVSKIPLTGRVQLLSDAFALAWSNQLNYSTALQLTNYLQHETEYLPLATGLKQLAKIENVLKRSADYGAYQKYVRKLITEQYMQAGGLAVKEIVNRDDLKSVRMQTMLSGWACRMRVPGCEENAIELFESWMNTEDPDKHNPIPLDLRRIVYCTSIARGSVRHWRFLLARKQRANVAAAQDALQSALSCTREVWILKQYLEWAITDGSDIRRQDAGRVIADIASSPVGYYVAKEFIYNRIDDIFVAFKRQGRHMKHVVKSLVSQFTTQKELDEFLVWRDANAKYFEEVQLAVSQAIESANVNINWLNRNKKTVIDHLREFSTGLNKEGDPAELVTKYRLFNIL